MSAALTQGFQHNLTSISGGEIVHVHRPRALSQSKTLRGTLHRAQARQGQSCKVITSQNHFLTLVLFLEERLQVYAAAWRKQTTHLR